MILSAPLRIADEEKGEMSPNFLHSFLYDMNFGPRWRSGLQNVQDFDFGSLNDSIFERARSYYEYRGSFTIPPCSEGVTWVLLKDPLPIQQIHLDLLQNLQGKSNRPLQQLNDRPIFAIPK